MTTFFATLRRRPLGAMYGILLLQHLPAFFVPILTKDEGFWWTIGRALADGGLLYRDAADNKPSLFLGYYHLACAAFGNAAPMILHVAVMIGNGVILALCYRMAKRTYGERIALWVALSYLLLQGSFVAQEILAANSENLMMPWAIGALFFYWSSGHATGDRSRLLLLLSGVLIGVACQIRQTALLLLPVFCLHRFVTAGGGMARCRTVGWLTGGASLAIAPALLYFWHRGTLDDYWFWNVTMTREYVSEPLPFHRLLWEGCWKTATIGLAGGLIWYLVGSTVGRWRAFRRDADSLLFCCFFIGMGLALLIGWRFSHHYYIQLFPAAALLVGFALRERTRAGQSLLPLRPLVATLCLAVPFVGFTTEAYYRWHEERHGGRRPHIRAVAEWLRAHAHPSDRLFIWGYYPEIYPLADLPNASRFVEIHFLTGQVRDKMTGAGLETISERLWQWLFTDLARHPPEWIVDTSVFPVSGRYLHPVTRYPAFQAYVTRHYALAATVAGAPIYQRHP